MSPLSRITLTAIKGESCSNNRRRLVYASVLGLALITVIAIAGFCLYQTAVTTDLSCKNLAPTLTHIFGTDQLGRDMFARTLTGLSMSLLAGILASALSCVLATVLASLAVLGPKFLDQVIQALIDFTMGIPHLLLLILISYALGRGFVGVAVGISLTHWPRLTRLLRSELLQIKTSEFMRHSELLGVSSIRIAMSHVIPGLLPHILTGFILTLPHAILHESSITFLGFGLSPETPAIGVILSESMTHVSSGAWWLAVFPGVLLVLCILYFGHIANVTKRLRSVQTAQE